MAEAPDFRDTRRIIYQGSARVPGLAEHIIASFPRSGGDYLGREHFRILGLLGGMGPHTTYPIFAGLAAVFVQPSMEADYPGALVQSREATNLPPIPSAEKARKSRNIWARPAHTSVRPVCFLCSKMIWQ